MMTTAAQLVIATILNLLGMAPEEHQSSTPMKEEIRIDKQYSNPLKMGKEQIYFYNNVANALLPPSVVCFAAAGNDIKTHAGS